MSSEQRFLTPFFETSAKETFNYRELRANFHIVNADELTVSVVGMDGQPAADFDITLAYEGEVVHKASTRDLPAPEVVAVVVPPPPDSGLQPPAKPLPRLPIKLLRGRNLVTIRSLDDAGVEFAFPMFFKTPARDWAESILKALIILVLIQFFVIQTFFIPTGSMKNTLMEKDFIMVEKVSYLFQPPQRGDVVVFQYPEDPRKDFIKRMVARESDQVEVSRKQLSINGHEVREPYVSLLDGEGRPEKVPRFQYDRDFFGPHPVPDRCIFVMGDNRNYSLDSRMWGPLPLWRMKGKAFLVYWPRRHFGLIQHVGEPFRGVDEKKPVEMP
jgi:signal peptidase I